MLSWPGESQTTFKLLLERIISLRLLRGPLNPCLQYCHKHKRDLFVILKRSPLPASWRIVFIALQSVINNDQLMTTVSKRTAAVRQINVQRKSASNIPVAKGSHSSSVVASTLGQLLSSCAGSKSVQDKAIIVF